MKKIKNIILTTLVIISMLYITSTNVFASSASISVSKSSPKVGDSVQIKVTVANVNTVDLHATVSGAGTSGKINIVDGSMSGDAKNFSGSVTVKPTTTGTIVVSISSGSNAVLNGNYVDVSGSKSISVSAASSSSTGGSSSNTSGGSTSSSTTQKEDNKSKDNNLSSLSVSKGTLSPEFSVSTKTYLVNLTSDVTDFSISAKAKDSKAKVSGTGEKDLVIGKQTFEIVVTAENGSKKTYAITVNVTEKPTVFTKFNNKDLGLLSDVSKVKAPDGYEGINVTLEGETIQGWTNKTNGLTLVYLSDADGNKKFYIYEDGKIVNEYNEITILGNKYVILDAPKDLDGVKYLKSGTVKIGDIELNGWTFEDKEHANYSVIYLMNDAGEKNLYSYEGTEGTLQKYVPNIEKNDMNMMTYIFIGTTAVFAVSTAAVAYLYMSFKKKSISAIRDYYERKNQDFD